MASGIKIRTTISGIERDYELSELLEEARGPEDLTAAYRVVDPSLLTTTPASGLDGFSKFFAPPNLNWDSGFDLGEYVSTPNHTMRMAARIGRRPRVSNNAITIDSIDASGTIYYYFVQRTEDNLYIYRHTSLSGTFTDYKTVPKSFFPKSYVPHFIYFEIVAGGGGGGGGSIFPAGFPTMGAPGGGGAVAYGAIPLPTRSIKSQVVTSTDFVFRIGGGGGGGGRGAVWFGDSSTGGGAGASSYVYKNGTNLMTVGGGGGGIAGKSRSRSSNWTSGVGGGGKITVHNNVDNFYVIGTNGAANNSHPCVCQINATVNRELLNWRTAHSATYSGGNSRGSGGIAWGANGSIGGGGCGGKTGNTGVNGGGGGRGGQGRLRLFY